MKAFITASLLAALATPAAAQTVSDTAKAPRAPLELDLDRPAEAADTPAADSDVQADAKTEGEAEASTSASDPAASAVNDMLAADEQDAAVEKAASDKLASAYSIDTPIMLLVADKRARAVLDKDMPGLSTDENYDKFKTLSLRQLQPKTGGQLTDELLLKVQTDLKAIGAKQGDDTATAGGEGR
ncbi:hypothetical protein [Stakelama marina]|uniref:Uncharacterized protein n=1 Tax=Stakelama marina TaxID=2826939 RepID=A0A8T4IGQ6_9SPHN|nr:hypothetical protein [Stakelama marina]MBR0553671.1 hypothetical protein [Stakelama marina]